MQFQRYISDCDVSVWLTDLFKDEMNAPEFDEGNKCTEVLKKLMLLNQESDKDITEVTKTDLYLTDFFTELITSDDAITDFYIKNLPTNYTEQVQLLASIAVQLSLKEPSLTNFLLSLNSLENKSQQHLEECIVNLYSKSKYSKKNIDLLQNNTIIERKIEPLEKIVAKQRALKSKNLERINFLKIKAKEYNKRIKKQQIELNNLGFNPSLSHSELVKKADDVKNLEKSVQHLRAKVNKYKNLPPNEMLARLKAEELKTKLLEKQQEFQEFLKYS